MRQRWDTTVAEAIIITLAVVPFMLGYAIGLGVRAGLWTLAIVMTAAAEGYARGSGR